MRDLQGRTAVVTGGASGLGLAMARRAHALGMRLLLADVEAGALAAAVAELRAGGADVRGEVVDVADEGAVARLADRAFEAGGDVGLLVNNAGVGGGGGFLWETSAADWDWVLSVNVKGVVHGIRRFLPRMLAAEAEGRPSHVLVTASVAGWLATPMLGPYSASKHAAVAVAETLFHDLRAAGSRIGVTLLCPAWVPTGIARSERNRPGGSAGAAPASPSQQAARALVERAVAAGRVTADEVARMALDAVVEDRFLVLTHPRILPAIHARHASVLSGGAPADPAAGRPQSP